MKRKGQKKQKEQKEQNNNGGFDNLQVIQDNKDDFNDIQIFQDNDGDPDNLYLNVRINHNVNNASFNTIAAYDVTKTTPYLLNPSKFYCSVLSATIPLNVVPLGIARTTINPDDAADPNYMTATVTITSPAGAVPTLLNSKVVHLSYIPTSDHPPPYPSPTATNLSGQILGPYYYFYTYSNILQSFNNALLDSFNYIFPSGPVFNAGAPYFFMDYDTGLIKLVVSDEFINSADLYLNYESVYYLQAFNYYAGSVNPQLGTDTVFKFVFYNFNNICDYYGQNFGVAGGGYWLYSQEFYNLQDFTSTRKILLTTNFIPIKPEFVSINNYNGTQTGLSPTANIIFDYTPNIKTGTDAKSINYYESATPRLCDLSGGSPLSRIDLNVFWQDIDGNVYPLYISVYQAVNVKLGFFRKSLYKNNWKKIKVY